MRSICRKGSTSRAGWSANGSKQTSSGSARHWAPCSWQARKAGQPQRARTMCFLNKRFGVNTLAANAPGVTAMEAASAIHAIPIASFLEADHFASTFKRRTSLSSFLNDASYFFREWLRDVHTQSRFEGVEGDSLETSYNVLPELEFGAEVHILSEKEITVNVNLGVLFCLQDLALRACSAETFFNPHPGDHDFELAWQGSRCRAPLQTFPPRLRYWDYSTTGPQIDPRLFDIWQATGTTPKSSVDRAVHSKGSS